MLQGILLSDGYWITISHSYCAIQKRRLPPRRFNRSNGLPVGYHHRVFLKPSDLKNLYHSNIHNYA